MASFVEGVSTVSPSSGSTFKVSLLDYGAGNVRSLRNAIIKLGFEIHDILNADEILSAEVIVFPGQGSFKQAMKSIRSKGWYDALRSYLLADRPFFGICLGMQLLFEGSEESVDDSETGLCVIPGRITKFDSTHVSVPQIGWNGVSIVKDCCALENIADTDMVYFVHSYCALPTAANLDWILALTDYGEQRYVSMVSKGNVMAAQFHPEKSGNVGLEMIRAFLSTHQQRKLSMSSAASAATSVSTAATVVARRCSSAPAELSRVFDACAYPKTQLANRVIACLDVRSNDAGDLVVTKGDQYDVREAKTAAAEHTTGRGGVRNLGKPVSLCKRYYDEGADEVVFLNITSFRQGVLDDLPMLQVLESSSENVFVPLTVGGGIRGYVDGSGREWTALEVAARYFRAGADKISIGSDAVFAAEEFLSTGKKTGLSSIEQIYNHYGAQAVVVSIDPKRVYVSSPAAAPAGKAVACLEPLPSAMSPLGPNGEAYCWWQVTVKGGRETRDLDAIALARACEELGAGEIMLNCIDMDGQNSGYDLALISLVQSSVSIPVIASSGAGKPAHFVDAYSKAKVNAALAAGIFHRQEVGIQEVKQYIKSQNLPVRINSVDC